MGETTCFMQPFSYASGGLPCDHHPLEGNPMHHALTQSISFGRFASESTSWDRWSAFPGNRYVEEAEKFSRPGSVAQKKAFFEAHYKNMAARKAAAAAAMLEQTNAATKSDCECGVVEDVSCNELTAAGIVHDNDRSIVVESRDDHRNDPVHGTFTSDASESHVKIPKSEFERTGKSETSTTSREDRGADPVHEIPKSEFERTGKSETSSTSRVDRVADPVNREDSVQEEPLLQFPVSDHLNEAGDVESSESAEMEKPLLKDFVCEEVSEVADQKEPAVVFSKISRNQKASSGVTSSPDVALLTPRPYWKGNIATTPIGRDSMVDHSDMKRSTPRRLPLGYPMPVREVNKATTTISWRMGKPKPSSGQTKDCRTPAKDFVCEEVSEVADQKEPAVVCSKISRNQKASSGVTASPAVALLTPRPYWKGNIATTPIGRDSMVDCSDMKRSTPRRLPLGYLTPVREINKATTTISWRMGNPKPSSSSTKDCRTPAKTPTAAPSHATSKYTLTSPKSVNERTTPAGDGKQTGPKRRSLSKECSKFLSACKNKLQSPSLSTPFRLRTEERAARRKEKLEEKFNAERERIQLQHILKEKEEMKEKKFRQTLCFKARPLPKFYRENATATTKTPTKKAVTNCSETTKRSRKPWSSSTTTLPNRASPHFQGKKLVLGMSLWELAPENRSPNIQE